MKDGIKYKDTKAMPGSDLYKLLEAAASAKTPKERQEFLKKAETCYNECEQRYQKSIGGKHA